MSMIGRQPARAAMTADDIGNNTIDSNKIINSSIVAADIGALDASVMTGIMPVGVTGGSGLTALGTVASGNLSNTAIVYPAGHVKQTLNFSNLYATSTTSTSYQNVEQSSGVVWEPSITPSATSSKVLFTASICVQGDRSGASEGRGDVQISTQIGSGSYAVKGTWNESIGAYDRGGGGVWIVKWLNWTFLQDTNTTDAVKIKIELKALSGAEVAVGGGTRLSTITLQEIAG